ncbi:MAG: CCA tRNA nucleotidyltransferase, partial [Proteobacteria bacterium]|nr:CCA tRNA nucleotidyltransferase [Pseudomonadota bacterium]
MPILIQTPAVLLRLAQSCESHGGRAYLVGGGVRDFLMGLVVKDWDLEVYGLGEDQLVPVLRQYGHVNEVGRAFSVFKLTVGEREIDISIPRRDSNIGPGHRGIAVSGDPFLSPREAARRRDLTVNALMYDLLSRELLDSFGGRKDLEDRVLRAVDEETFLEDPLRALRVVQFAARLEFSAD